MKFSSPGLLQMKKWFPSHDESDNWNSLDISNLEQDPPIVCAQTSPEGLFHEI